MADDQRPATAAPLPRIAILLAYNGNITDIHCASVDAPLDIVIATKRKDGEITGRPITMLATPDDALVAKLFERAAR